MCVYFGEGIYEHVHKVQVLQRDPGQFDHTLLLFVLNINHLVFRQGPQASSLATWLPGWMNRIPDLDLILSRTAYLDRGVGKQGQ